jgi:hypothetical protein
MILFAVLRFIRDVFVEIRELQRTLPRRRD